VAQGYSQKFGVNYDEVFAPVVRSATMRMLLLEAGARKHLMKQYDIKTAVLNGTLSEEIYMKPPPGQYQKDGKVYRLRKSLYGLKQAAHV
jgi:Reverse transcriptase (RNA-dependent DNA polymerase)